MQSGDVLARTASTVLGCKSYMQNLLESLVECKEERERKIAVKGVLPISRVNAQSVTPFLESKIFHSGKFSKLIYVSPVSETA